MPQLLIATSGQQPEALIYIEISMPLNESLRDPEILEKCLRTYKERIERVCPLAWDALARNLVRIAIVPVMAYV